MRFTRSILADVEGYVPGEQPRDPNVIKLNTNENPYPPSPKVVQALQQLSPEAVRKYSDPLSMAFREACARRYELDGPDWVIAGNGMDEVLALTVRTLCDPGDSIVAPYPTYTLYDTLARLHGAAFETIDLDDQFGLPEAMCSAQGRLLFLARPNAPTGVLYPREQVERLCRAFKGIVFIDEAYVDFADNHCMDLPKRFDNVIVGRTFSKAYSLAGMRVGIGVAQPDIIREFLKTKDSYNMNAASQAAGLAAIEDHAAMRRNAEAIRATRARLASSLNELGFQALESQANFVLAFRAGEPSARSIFEALRARGIFVRYFDARRLDTALRISVGTETETDALLEALQEILS